MTNLCPTLLVDFRLLTLMPTFILLLWVGIAFSVHSGMFLSIYYGLVQTGKKAKGVVVSLDRGHFVFLRSILVPILGFETEDGYRVEGLPEHSYFMELNGFDRKGEVTVYYQKDNPKSFVIESRKEVLLNWIIMASTAGAILWLFLH